MKLLSDIPVTFPVRSYSKNAPSFLFTVILPVALPPNTTLPPLIALPSILITPVPVSYKIGKVLLKASLISALLSTALLDTTTLLVV